MCSKNFHGNIFYEYLGEVYNERIPVRFSEITHIPFPDNLHVYNQTFNGYHKLARKFGPFKVDEESIGVNNNHVAKVWHSANFS